MNITEVRDDVEACKVPDHQTRLFVWDKCQCTVGLTGHERHYKENNRNKRTERNRVSKERNVCQNRGLTDVELRIWTNRLHFPPLDPFGKDITRKGLVLLQES